MTVRNLMAKMKPRQPAQPAQGGADAAAEAAKAARAQATAQREIEKARADAAKAQAEAAQARAEADRVRIENAVTTAASKARATHPGQVAALLTSRVKLVEGKLAVEGSDKDVDGFVSEWLTTEGKHFLAPSVPSGGSGAPTNPNGAPPPKAHDLSSAKGMTEYARERESQGIRTPQQQAQRVAQQRTQ